MLVWLSDRPVHSSGFVDTVGDDGDPAAEIARRGDGTDVAQAGRP
jgi:hypothetical protein